MKLKPWLRNLTIIHTALLVSMIAFGVFAYFWNGQFRARMSPRDPFIYIVPVLAAVGYFLSQFLFKKQLETIQKEEKLHDKLSKYKSATFVQYALLEVPGILALSAYILSGNALYLVIGMALIAYLFVQRPTAEKIKKNLPLTLAEQKQFDNLQS